MARANRHYIPGHVWHITHRCHRRDFLLKFAKDRYRWLQWLLEARKRYGLLILNYIVTSNHIHLLVCDSAGKDAIPRSIQLVAGRIGQEYNVRKGRQGAFWEDRYHATAIESGKHLIQCLVYIDLNMVRAGVVKHPSDWKFGGYSEINYPRRKLRLIEHDRLMALVGVDTLAQLRDAHIGWVEEVLSKENLDRESMWTESIAVGSRHFAEITMQQLGGLAKGRRLTGSDAPFELREPQAPYLDHFDPKNSNIGAKNTYSWDDNP